MATFTPKHLECRDLGHAWETSAPLERTDEGRYQRQVTCIRCGTTRVDRFNLGHQVVEFSGRTYRYAKDYVVKGGLPRAEARALLFFPRKKVRK